MLKCLIKNKEEFEEKYPYQKQYIKKYPNTYPCVLEIEYHEGGLAGSYESVKILENMNNFLVHNGVLYKKC